MTRDELTEAIGRGDYSERFGEWDSHWQEVMREAERHGFIVYCYGGVATLATNEEQLRQLGAEKKASMLKAAGME